MRKQIALILCFFVFCITTFYPLYANATTSIDPAKETQLTLYYKKDKENFPELNIQIYRVAETLSNGTFQLIEPFNTYPVNIDDITNQEQWDTVSSTLTSYIVANSLAPYKEKTTTDKGVATFKNLETGLYLVNKAVAETNKGTYIFNQFMVYLPTPQPDGTFDYTIEAKPKCTVYAPENKYQVTKLWKDASKETNRPKEVAVDIYKNGKLWETQTLNTNNNWSYIWYDFDGKYNQWAVVEHSVSNSYTVTIKQNKNCFSITNTHKSNLGFADSPQTGDTSNLLLWVLIMCISGVTLIIIGVYSRRRESV